MPRPPDVGVGTSAIITRLRAQQPGAPPRRQVLLGLRRGAHGAGLWSFSGGWVDRGDPSLEVALAREVAEETGIEVPPAELKLFAATTEDHADADFSSVTVFYLVTRDAEAPRPLEPHKCAEWRWFFVDDPPAELFGSVGVILRKLAESERRRVTESIPCEAQAVMCSCGGYAEYAKCTPDEVRLYDCERGRLFPSTPCCARAFVCRICGARILGKAEAPEME